MPNKPHDQKQEKMIEQQEKLLERLEHLEMRKVRLKNKINQDETRKERTRRLIQVGAIFEKYFDIDSVEQAEQHAYRLKKIAEKNREEIEKTDVEKSMQSGKVIYKESEEKLITPDSSNQYKTS
ncbi:hypothetical protein GCM10011351_31900 [Paraliobacillus quinghaiensis]|uniref:DUF3847 domain-containing protein n=1 Tax=Paraliobacillus quinghaiensis TaxID=470815 RepID=A0A917WXX9_9BACI|nr:hypothetical protein [Paraliobacillus quinghaiensis]GGM43539.1 hypothetical protein GCM10011351_31900 [Paraliobacillus quinghaiensis]